MQTRIVVAEPKGSALLPYAAHLIVASADDDVSLSYWTASAWVSNVVGSIENDFLREWTCRTLNDAVIAKATKEKDHS